MFEYLYHLERERGCSVQTRNQRLAAIRSFARYVSVRDAALVEWGGSIRAIPLKKTVRLPECLLEPTSQTLYPAWPHRAGGACRSPCADTRRATDHAACTVAQLRVPLASLRRRYQYHSGLARPRVARNHQHLRRSRSQSEGRGDEIDLPDDAGDEPRWRTRGGLLEQLKAI